LSVICACMPVQVEHAFKEWMQAWSEERENCRKHGPGRGT